MESLCKYLAVKSPNVPQQILLIKSRNYSFFINEILDKFGNKFQYSRETGNRYGIKYLFHKIDEIDLKTFNRILRDIRVYFNKLLLEHSDLLYKNDVITPVDWYKYEYVY